MAVLRVLLIGIVGAAAACAQPIPTRSWIELRTPDVRVFVHEDPDRVASLAQSISWFRPILEHVSGHEPSDRTEHVAIFLGTGFELDDFSPVPKSAGVFLEGAGGSLVLVETSDLLVGTRETLLHEYVHFHLAHSQGPFPAWYQEGLAEYASSLRIASGQIVLGEADLARLNLLQGRNSTPLDTLLVASTEDSHYRDFWEGGDFHGTSWALFHYLRLGRPDGPAALDRYLALLREDVPSPEALERALNLSLNQLNADLRTYLSTEPLPTETLPAAQFQIKKPRVRRRTLEEEEVGQLEELLENLRKAKTQPAPPPTRQLSPGLRETARRLSTGPGQLE